MNYLSIENPMIAAAQRQMDAEAERDAWEEQRWERMWDELDAALEVGILSDESYNAIRQAMDEDLK